MGQLLKCFALFFLLSCATPPTQKKAAHFNVNPVPRLALLSDINWRALQRQPSSEGGPSTLGKYSNRQIYFRALYQQFQSFKSSISSFSESLDRCPGFHTTFIMLQKANSLFGERSDFFKR